MNNLPRALAFVLLAPSLILSARAEPFQIISSLEPAQAPPVGGSGDSSSAVISANGRFVLFASTANNLATGTNTSFSTRIPAALNVFLRDRTNNTTALVNANLSGTSGGNADSFPVDISPDGRYALFESSASNLTPNDTNNSSDVFLRDLLSDTTVLVSTSTNNAPGNGASRNSAMTPDARYVTFVSAANNLVAGDNNRIPDVFLRDLQAGTTLLVSVGAVSTNTTIPGGSSEAPAITPDGRFVVFTSTATNLVPGVRAIGDVYLRDLLAGTTTWASAGARTAAFTSIQSSNITCFSPVISDDGQYVAFAAGKNASAVGVILRYNVSSGSTDVVHTNAAVTMGQLDDGRSLDMTPDGRFIAFIANTNGNNGTTTCICVWDAQSRSITLASADRNGQASANTVCDWPTITSDGRYVAFLSSASNLTANTIFSGYHLYVRDLQAGTTSLIDADTNGIGSIIGPATVPRLSADGRFAAFDSPDGNLVPNDRNGNSDVFVRDLLAASTELVSAHAPSLASGTPNGPSSLATAAINPDGRFVAFGSEADNLSLNDTNGCRDIFLSDFASTTPLLVSVNTNGFTGDGPSTDPALSADGRFVAFTSAADDLISGDANHLQDVFIRDLQTGATTLVTVNSNNAGPANKASYSPCLSSDGRYVLFRSLASNLAPGTFSGENLFLRDLVSSNTYPLTFTGVALATMNPDANLVGVIGAFSSGSGTNLYVWDTKAAGWSNTNLLTSLSSFRNLVATRDGTRFAFSATGAAGVGRHLYLANIQTGTTVAIDPAVAGTYPGLRFSRDGLLLVYTKNVGTTNQLCAYDLQTTFLAVLNESYSPPAAPLGSANSLDISPDARFIV
ncbi:MAG TPA: hypothetical protein VL361_29095, partial [Candidatus Limnocylindrales bacterium]|nr:hypothetical protein [Candidatus Limnocylindrales bacterium]